MSPTLTVISLLVTGVAGMAGWFFAWLARGDAIDAIKAIGVATAGEGAAKELLLEAQQKLVTATTQLTAASARGDNLQTQLDSARKGNQDLVHALAKAGAPVGPMVVDVALGGLYPDGDTAGAGAGADAGGGGSAVPGEPPAIARTSTRR